MYEKLNVENAKHMNAGIRKNKMHVEAEKQKKYNTTQAFSQLSSLSQKCASGKKPGFNYLIKF